MAKPKQKIALSQSRDIPFNRLVLSQSNVRHVKAGVSIDELAQDIARRTLLQSLTVRPILDADSAETGMFEIPAGGRRYRALELLVKQKRLSRTAPIPCVVRTEGFAEEVSLAACPYQAIIDTAKERGCDLIVMASHGRRGVSAIVLGSETIKVLIHGTIPVIVVRSQNASQYFAAS